MSSLLLFIGALHGIPAPAVSCVPITCLCITGIIGRDEIRQLPWDVLLLIAGGLSLGIGIANSGLALWITELLPLQTLPQPLVVLAFAYAISLLSNVMSNTAAANVLLPIGLATTDGKQQVVLGIVLALSASSAMCLPISTPPNAIAYATGVLSSRHLLKPGLIVALITPPLALLWCSLVAMFAL